MKKQTQPDRLYSDLIAYISKTPLLPGNSLPSERRLAEIFKSSRNSVREAIRMLQIRNIVEVKKGSGCYVKRTLGPDTRIENCTIQIDCIDSAEHLNDQLEARSLLVPRLIQLAMSKMTPDYLEQLENTLVRLSQAIITRDYTKIIEEDACFHRVLTEAIGNRLLMVIYRPLELTLNSAKDIFSRLSDHDINEIFAGYVGILTALRKKDLENIESHVKKTMETMQSLLNSGTEAVKKSKKVIS